MKKYSRFAIYLFTGELSVRILGFCANVYLARVLDTAGFGLIIIGISFLTYSILLSDSGLRTLGFIEASKSEQERQLFLPDILTVKSFHALLSFLILYIISFFLFKDNKLHTICVFYLLNIFYDALFIDWYFQGLQRFRTVACARITATLVYVITLYFYVKAPADSAKIPILFFISNIFSVLILFVLLPSTSFKINFSFSIKKYLTIIRQSLILGIGSLLTKITIYLPPIAIGIFAGINESGIFGAAMRIVIMVMIIDRIFSIIFISSLPRMWESDKNLAKKNLQIILNISLAAGFLLSLELCILSKPIIHIVFGDSYKDGNLVLSIVSWFFALTMVNSIVAYGLISIGNKKYYLHAALKGFLLNVLLILLFTYLYGILGASIAIVVSELCFIIFFQHEFKRYCSLNFYFPFLKTCIACALSFALITFLPVALVGKAIISIATFGVLIFVLKIVTKNDVTTLITKCIKN